MESLYSHQRKISANFQASTDRARPMSSYHNLIMRPNGGQPPNEMIENLRTLTEGSLD